MRPVTLIYCLRNDEVLLGMKKRGFAEGKLNGYGGKANNDETIVACAARELSEEANIHSKEHDYEKVAEIDFYFPDVPKEKNFDQTVHVFILRKWTDEPVETEEMKPQWYSINNLPMDKMWVDDPYWLHDVLNGKKVRATFKFKGHGESLKEHKVEFVDNF